MIILSILLLQIFYIFCLPASDAIMKGKELEDLEKRAKALACNFLTSSSLLAFADKEKQIKDLLKKNKIFKKDSEAQDKIQNFMTSICYSKIDSQTANEILIKISEGHTEIPGKDKYKHYFDFDMKGDFKKYKKIMNELNKVMKDIEAEEKALHEKRKDDPELEKDMKDLERKLIKNKKYEEKLDDRDDEDDDEKIENKNDKRKNKLKKRREKKKKEEIKKEKEEKEENEVPRRKRPFSFKNLIGAIDINTIWPFVISLLIILIFPFIFMPTNNNHIRNNKIIKGKGENQLNKNTENEENKNNIKKEKKELNNKDEKNNKENNKNIQEKEIKKKIE